MRRTYKLSKFFYRLVWIRSSKHAAFDFCITLKVQIPTVLTLCIISCSLVLINAGGYDSPHTCGGSRDSNALFKRPLVDTECDMSALQCPLGAKCLRHRETRRFKAFLKLTATQL